MQNEPASTNPPRQDVGRPSYVDLCRAQAKPLSILAACCTLVVASYSESILTVLNQFASIYSFSFFVMLFALVLPGRLFLLSIVLAVGSFDAFDRVNQLEISALSLPITFVDVRTVIADPVVLVNAVGIRDELNRIVFIAFGVLAFVLLACAFYKLRGYSFLDHLKLWRARETRYHKGNESRAGTLATVEPGYPVTEVRRSGIYGILIRGQRRGRHLSRAWA